MLKSRTASSRRPPSVKPKERTWIALRMSRLILSVSRRAATGLIASIANTTRMHAITSLEDDEDDDRCDNMVFSYSVALLA